MTNSESSSVGAAALLGLLTPIFRRYRLRLITGFAALLGVDFLQLLIPRILKKGVDTLSQQTATHESLLHLGLLILLIAAVVAVLRFSWRTLIIGFSRLLERSLREQLFSHLLKLDRRFYSRWSTGALMAHASNDLSAIQMACGMGMVAAVDALVMSTAAICFMMAINVRLTLLALLPMPLLALGTKILSGRMHKHFTVVQEQFGLLTEFVRSTVVSIRLIKGYCLEGSQEKAFAVLGKQYVQGNLKVAVIQGLLHPLATLTGNLGMLLVLLFGGQLVVRGSLTLGDFVAFISYLAMLVWPMMAIGWVANLVQRGMTSLRRIFLLLQAEPTVVGGGVKTRLTTDIPIIRCQNLTFTYPEAKNPSLRDISLELKAGIFGVTGRTGSGKSTFCRLLPRLYQVDDGMIFLGGQDINTQAVSSIRDHIGYVGQQMLLFSDTIYNNICFGRPEVEREQVESAARAAAIHDDILAFPDGYDSLIGERGVKLSGGQRQRLALARALLCDRSILIIDDGLSALDVETEQKVFTAIRQQYQGRLVLLVSHRINLLRSTDRIIEFDQGRVVATGGHQEMIAASTLYRAMTEKQQDNA